MNHLGFVIAQHHDLGDVQKTAREREGADGACQHGTVGDLLASAANGLYVKPRARVLDGRQLQRVRLLLRFDDVSRDDGNLVVAYTYASAQRLGLDREIHHADGCRAVDAVGNQLHAARLRLCRGDQLADGNIHQLYGREG